MGYNGSGYGDARKTPKHGRFTALADFAGAPDCSISNAVEPGAEWRAAAEGHTESHTVEIETASQERQADVSYRRNRAKQFDQMKEVVARKCEVPGVWWHR